MSKIREFFANPHIQIALATAVSIVLMAWFSKRVFTEPIGYLPLALPPFIATIYEALASKNPNRPLCTTWYWIVAILGATALILILTWN